MGLPVADLLKIVHVAKGVLTQAASLSTALVWKHICDMIKGNESNVGNVDFELQA